MANEILLKQSGIVVFADHGGDYAGADIAQTGGTGQIDLTGVVPTEGRESVIVDFGATRAERYQVIAEIEFASAPTAGKTVDIYVAPHTTDGAPHVGKTTGSDADWAHAVESQYVGQLDYVGSLVCSADGAGTPIIGVVGAPYTLPTRYASIVVVNSADQNFDGDATHMFVAFVPLIDEIQ